MALENVIKTIPLFKGLEEKDLALVASYLHKERYPKGSIIFREGDAGDTMYLVESGQVAVFGRDEQETIAFMGPGSFVGEISLLLAQPRTASLQVMIDAELWAMRRHDFEQLINTRPGIAREMMRELNRRLVATTQRKKPLSHRRITALFGSYRKGTELCQAIHERLYSPVGLLTLPGVTIDVNPEADRAINSGFIPLDNDNLTETSLVEGLSYQVDVYNHVVLLLPDRPSPLARKALDLADTVISIGSPPDWAPSSSSIPSSTTSNMSSSTTKSMNGHSRQEFWTIEDTKIAIERAARRLTNRSVGLALSSGGARNLAHIGVMKVLIEENIPVDMVAGTSGGAWFGALFCAGWTPEQFDEFVFNIKKHILRFQNADFNFPPRTALFKGRKARDRVIAETVGVKTFAELQTPLYIVAADILKGEEIVFKSGSLTDAIRASLGVPVLFEPWRYQGRYFVDGGVVNPLPASVLQQNGADIIIGSSVIQSLRESYSGPKDKMPHILQSVFNIFSAMESEVVKEQLPLVDILVQHKVAVKHTLDFDRAVEMMRSGEEATRRLLPDIKAAIEAPPEM